MDETTKKSMKKKLISSIVCFALLMVMLLGSTLAWFTDTQANTNTMVAGKISIEQTDLDKDGKPFEAINFVMMPSQTIVKKVTVENTGNQPCYLRTLFAFEDSADGSVLEMLTTAGAAVVIPGVTDQEQTKVQFTVTKDGATTLYTVGYYIHPTALACEGEVTVLQSITLDSKADNSWSDAVGAYYELIILSQASQTEGLGDDASAALDTAFAPITGENCAKWFAYVLNGTDSYVTDGMEATADGAQITIAAAENS